LVRASPPLEGLKRAECSNNRRDEKEKRGRGSVTRRAKAAKSAPTGKLTWGTSTPAEMAAMSVGLGRSAVTGVSKERCDGQLDYLFRQQDRDQLAAQAGGGQQP